jgi:hypothetical protein
MDPLTPGVTIPGVTIPAVECRFGPLVEEDISMVFMTAASANLEIYPEV